MLNCPNCGSTEVKKSSVIIEQGTYQEYVNGPNPYTPGNWRTYRTPVAEKLLADKPKEAVIGCESGFAQICLVGFGLISFCVAIGAIFGLHNLSVALGGLIGALICGGFSILLLVISATRRAQYRRQWTADLVLWEQDLNRQYYCFHCGCIFYI